MPRHRSRHIEGTPRNRSQRIERLATIALIVGIGAGLVLLGMVMLWRGGY